MTKVGSRELKNRLGHFLTRVRRGETLLVTDRGRPVATIVPTRNSSGTNALEGRLKDLAAAGHLRLGSGLPFPKVTPVKTRGKMASRMIIEDRR